MMGESIQAGSSSTQRYDGTSSQQVFSPISAMMKVAIVVLLDATSSMGFCIEGVKRGILGMIDILLKGGMKVDLGLVIFRDELIGEMPECHDVGTSPERLKAILAATRAMGGGDIPESSLPAIHRALNLQGYTPGAKKVLFLLTDAPPHNPEGGISSQQILAMLKEQQVLFFACAPEIEPYKRFVAETQGHLFPMRAGLGPDSFKDIVHQFGAKTARTLRMAGGVDLVATMQAELRKTLRIS